MDNITLKLSVKVRDNMKDAIAHVPTESMLMAFVHRMRVEWNLYQSECEEKYNLPDNAVDFNLETDVDAK